jgi:hypothetical protein
MGLDDFKQLKEKLLATVDVDEMFAVMQEDLMMAQILAAEHTDVVLAEIAALDPLNLGPLGEFPPDVNSNYFVRIVTFGMEKLPRLTGQLAKLATRGQCSLVPKDVLRVACAIANHVHLATGLNIKTDIQQKKAAKNSDIFSALPTDT